MTVDPVQAPVLRDKAFLLLLVAVSLAFAWVLLPFFSAVFWATVLAVLFAPLYRYLFDALGQRRTLAALLTECVVVLMAILPTVLIAALITQEAAGIIARLRSGELDVNRFFHEVMAALPAWATGFLDRLGLADLSSLEAKLSSGLMRGAQFLAQNAFNVGQNTLEFVVSFFIMLYLLFFLLRDGRQLARRIRDAVPLRNDLLQTLSRRFTDVIRATVKGNLVVAAVQGLLGGLIFWYDDIHAPVLWGVVMAFVSLLPAGSGVVWAPVAIYLIATGSVLKGILLIVYGMLVIGLVDNFLRPILVGKGTRMPDYVVLISTLGGLAIFGMNGFVIGPMIAAMFIAAWHIVATSDMNAGD
jgi:predicted PurR-regulated permease PerM